MSVDLSGSVRELAVGTRGTSVGDFQRRIEENPAECGLAEFFPDCAAFREVNDTEVFTSLTRLRLRLELQATQYFSAVITYDNELLAGILDTVGGQLLEELAPDPWLDIDGTIASGEHVEWRHSLYRGFIRFQSQHAEVTVGRQRILSSQSPWIPVEANGAPLSVLIASGSPCLRNRARKAGFAPSVRIDGRPLQSRSMRL